MLADYGQIVPAALLRPPARGAEPPSVAAAPAPRRDADPGGDPCRRQRDRRDPHADGRGPRHGTDRRAGPRRPRRHRDHAGARGASDGVAGPSPGPKLGPWLRGELEPQPQAADGATLTRPLRREDGRLDPTRSAVELERQVRAFQPGRAPSWTRPSGGLPCGRRESGRSGDIAGRRVRTSVGLGAGDRERLRLVEVQPAGGKRMPWEAFVRGHPGIVGSAALASGNDRRPAARPVRPDARRARGLVRRARRAGLPRPPGRRRRLGRTDAARSPTSGRCRPRSATPSTRRSGSTRSPTRRSARPTAG